MASRGTFLLVAVDPTDGGSSAVIDEAGALARDLDCTIRLLTAAPSLRDEDAQAARDQGLRDRLVELSTPLREQGVLVQCVVGLGDPAKVILERARLARLVVIGTHGRQGLQRLVFGSVAEAVLRESPTPVVVVHT